MQSLRPLLVVVAAFAASASVEAQQPREWPRFHVGVAVGQPRLGQDVSSVAIPPQFRTALSSLDSPSTERKLVAGFRPLRAVGVEIADIDLGDARTARPGSVHAGLYNDFLKTGAEATVLTAVLFIPEPSPRFDVYGKIGVAELEEWFQVHFNNFADDRCPPFCLYDNYEERTASRPYLGIGTRFEVAPQIGVRIEFEAIDRDEGDNTTMMSVGVAWEH